MESCSNPTVTGALFLIHGGMMECAGLPASALRAVSQPNVPLDLLWFYRSVALILADWEGSWGFNDVELASSQSYLTEPLLPELDAANRSAFIKFSARLATMPRTNPVDEAYCRWLFAETIFLPDLLPRVLDGDIAREIKRMENATFEEWAERWT